MTLLPMVLIILEYIPVLMFSPKIDKYHELSGTVRLVQSVATIADNFNVELPEFGKDLNEMGVEH